MWTVQAPQGVWGMKSPSTKTMWQEYTRILAKGTKLYICCSITGSKFLRITICAMFMLFCIAVG